MDVVSPILSPNGPLTDPAPEPGFATAPCRAAAISVGSLPLGVASATAWPFAERLVIEGYRGRVVSRDFDAADLWRDAWRMYEAALGRRTARLVLSALSQFIAAADRVRPEPLRVSVALGAELGEDEAGFLGHVAAVQSGDSTLADSSLAGLLGAPAATARSPARAFAMALMASGQTLGPAASALAWRHVPTAAAVPGG